MRCQFCHQDVDDPCHDAQQMQQRAMSRVERCEHALRAWQDMVSGANHHDIQGKE